MCGRFSLTRGDREDLEEEFGLPVPAGYRPRYNIAPTQEVLVLLDDGTRQIEALRWGLIPSWAKDPKIGHKLINARAETLFERPSFRSAGKERRCLILADGFYEWRKTKAGKTPMYIRLRSKRPFGFAGLWESWTSPEGQVVKTCAIVTTAANEGLKPIHDRMPVIVPKDLESIWLDSRVRSENELTAILRPYPAEEMEAYEVSRLVNSPGNDRPECLEPVRED
jgi:putative SOS response-associated peptidase YedK